MFDFPNSAEIKSHQDIAKAKILGSFHTDDNSIAQTSLIKGLSITEFEQAFPADKYERYSFDDLKRAEAELSKAEDFNEDNFKQEVESMKPVVLQSGENKKLVYVREKAVKTA